MSIRIPLAVAAAAAILMVVSANAIAAFANDDRGDGSPESPYRVPELTSEIRVDGVLDEDAWSEALQLELAYETNPGENTPAPVRTDLLLFSNNTHLYAAFRAFDPDPSAICANVTDRDRMFDDDRVSIIFDTFNDQRRSYMFFANPYGIQGDALDSYGMGGGDPSWDAIWDSAGRITGEGYVVEIAIPFSSLRFQQVDGEQVWGMGAGRKYSRSIDYRTALTKTDRNESCYLCRVAKIVGFENATPGRNIEFDPTVSGFLTQERKDFPEGELEEREKDWEAGVTARWGITPNLVLSGTLNPDFSQVEADAFQLEVNTQFALYYEEKRPFFLEGMEFFTTQLDAVYTRTIADPAWGGKLTGKIGENALGAFVTEDEVTNVLLPGSQGSITTSLPGRSTGTVLRYRRDVGSASTAGLIGTNREGTGYHNRVGGLDANIRITPSDRLEAQILGSRTQYPYQFADDFGQPLDEFDGLAYQIEYGHDTSSWDWFLDYTEIDDGFRADLGFRPQVDFRELGLGWGHTWRAEAGHWYSSLNVGSGYTHEEELSGEILDDGFTFWFDYNGEMRSWLNAWGIVGTEGYQGVEYDNTHMWMGGGLWPTGTTQVALETVFGNAIDYDNARPGRILMLSPSLDLKIFGRLALTPAHTYERLDVDEGRLYTANISYLRISYNFTRRTFLRAILQYVNYEFNTDLYDDERPPRYEQLASQILFSYKINPQTVLYLGYNDNHFGDQTIDLTQSDRTFFAKIGYAWVL